MSTDVNYADDANVVTNIAVVRGAPRGVIEWLIRSGPVKNAKQAQYLLLGIAVLIVIASGAMLYPQFRSYGTPLTAADVQQMIKDGTYTTLPPGYGASH